MYAGLLAVGRPHCSEQHRRTRIGAEPADPAVQSKGSPGSPPPGIRRGLVRQAHQIVYADAVKLRQCHNGIQRVPRRPDLILGIGILADMQDLGYLLLRQSTVDPDIPDSTVF